MNLINKDLVFHSISDIANKIILSVSFGFRFRYLERILLLSDVAKNEAHTLSVLQIYLSFFSVKLKNSAYKLLCLLVLLVLFFCFDIKRVSVNI